MQQQGTQRKNNWKALFRGLPIALGLLAIAGCNKETLPPISTTTSVEDPALRERIKTRAMDLPAVGIYNRTMDKIIVFNQFKDGRKSFNFINPPNNGINFSSSNGGQWVWTERGGLVVITDPRAGLGGGGGTVVAGNTTLDIAFATCFSVGEEAMGLDLFDTGINEVAGVIGIAGDLEALANGDFSAGDDLFDYFQGFAYYLVYADRLANTNYNVLNWFDDLDRPSSDLDGFGFSFVVGFQGEGGIYLSKTGQLSVNGGSIGFNGSYFGVTGIGFFDGSGEDDPSYTEVTGFGTMGCQ